MFCKVFLIFGGRRGILSTPVWEDNDGVGYFVSRRNFFQDLGMNLGEIQMSVFLIPVTQYVHSAARIGGKSFKIGTVGVVQNGKGNAIFGDQWNVIFHGERRSVVRLMTVM